MTPIVLDRAAVADATGLSAATIAAEVHAGRFPAPRKLTANRVGWLRREVEEWAEARPVSDLLPPANTSRRGAC